MLRKLFLSYFQQRSSRVCMVKSHMSCCEYRCRSKAADLSTDSDRRYSKSTSRKVNFHCVTQCLSKTIARQEFGNLTVFGRHQANMKLSTLAWPRYARLKKENVDEINTLLEENEDKVTELADLMKCDVDLVHDLIRKDSRTLTYSWDKVCSVLGLLMQNGFTAKDICTYPVVFTKNLATLERQLSEMQKVRCYKYKMHYLVLNQQRFYKYMAEFQKEVDIMGEHENRNQYVGSLLDCTEKDIVKYGEKHRFLLTRHLTSLTRVVVLLKEHGFSSNDIKQRLTSLHINGDEAARRFQVIDEKNLLDKDHIAYLLTENKRTFIVSLEAWQRDQDALAGHDSVTDYIQARLRCSREEVERIFTRKVALKFCHTSRFAEIFDLLLDDFNFPPSQILAKPQILVYSCNRLERRYKQIREQGVTSIFQIIDELCLTDADYCQKYDLIK